MTFWLARIFFFEVITFVCTYSSYSYFSSKVQLKSCLERWLVIRISWPITGPEPRRLSHIWWYFWDFSIFASSILFRRSFESRTSFLWISLKSCTTQVFVVRTVTQINGAAPPILFHILTYFLGFLLSTFSKLYESPGGNQVDGLPPVPVRTRC